MLFVVPPKPARTALKQRWDRENPAPEYWGWLWLQAQWMDGLKPTVSDFASAAGWSRGHAHRTMVKIRNVLQAA